MKSRRSAGWFRRKPSFASLQVETAVWRNRRSQTLKGSTCSRRTLSANQVGLRRLGARRGSRDVRRKTFRHSNRVGCSRMRKSHKPRRTRRRMTRERNPRRHGHPLCSENGGSADSIQLRQSDDPRGWGQPRDAAEVLLQVCGDFVEKPMRVLRAENERVFIASLSGNVKRGCSGRSPCRQWNRWSNPSCLS